MTEPEKKHKGGFLTKVLNRRTLIDILFYFGFSMIIWNTCRPLLGDYLAMLLSTVPGILYTIYTFIKEKQYSITGLFILATMVIGTIMNLNSKTGEQIIWNYVYLNLGYVVFWLLTLLIKRPMALYFFIDYAYLHGIPKEHTRPLYRQMPYFRYFNLLTLFMAARDSADVLIRLFLIKILRIDTSVAVSQEDFNVISLVTQIWGWAMTAAFVYFIILIVKKIQKNLHNPSGNSNPNSN